MASDQDNPDVFLSYAPGDDDPADGEWVTRFQEALSEQLVARLDRGAGVLMSARPPGEIDEETAGQLARSGVFVTVLSPAYLSMDSEPAELDYFLSFASDQPGGPTGRVFAVWKAPASPEILPEGLRQVPEHRFYEDESSGGYRTLWPDAEDDKERVKYAALIGRMADQIVDKLGELDALQATDLAAADGDAPAEPATAPQTVPPGETTGDDPATGGAPTTEAAGTATGTGAAAAQGAATAEAAGGAQPEGTDTTAAPQPAPFVAWVAELAGIDRGFAPDAEALLLAAASLLPQKQVEREVFSTTTLFLAAIEWGLPPGSTLSPPDAAVNLAAGLDRTALDALRADFFSSSPPGLTIDAAQPVPDGLAVTENVTEALRKSIGPGDAPIDATALLRALLRQTETAGDSGLRPRLDRLGTTAAKLGELIERGMSTHISRDLWTVDDRLGYSQYARAISNFLNDRRTAPPLTISVQAPWGGGKTSLMRMIQREVDPTGFALSDARRPAPPSAPAGIRLGDVLALAADPEAVIEKLKSGTDPLKLDGAQCASVWFNAWRYQSSDQIWAGLAEAIIRGITDRMAPPEREKFLLRLHLSRVNADKIRTQVYDLVLNRFLDWGRRFGLWALGGLVSLATILWRLAMPTLEGGMLAGASAVALGLLGSAGAYLKTRSDAKAESAKINLAEYVDVPDYSEKLGFIHHVTQDLERVFALLPETKLEDGTPRRVPLAIFIDDLDRCAPPKIAEVFEALNLFLAGEFRDCYIVIGMDTEVVAAALEEAHKDVIKRLPGDARRAPVGRRFMDKFVQLPFMIPPLDDKAVANYAESLAAAGDNELRKLRERLDPALHERIEQGLDRGEAEDKIVADATQRVTPSAAELPEAARAEGQRLVRQVFETIRSRRDLDEQARRFQRDNARIRDLLHRAKDDFSHNPRELKRLINLYRFYYNLWLARRTRQQKVPTEPQLQNWLMFSLAWPEAARWLQRSHSEWEAGAAEDVWSANGAGSRLARMESLAVAMVPEPNPDNPDETIMRDPTANDWSAALRTDYELPDQVKWPDDERLFAFFRRTALESDTEQLSAGAGRGFW